MIHDAVLALKDGRYFFGQSAGAKGEAYGEVVFNTGIAGYQEIFTDPSYSGQIVILTNPQIGNYGTNSQDNESARPYIEGLVVREFSGVASNWRSTEHAADFLAKQRIPIITEIDTRALVRHLRSKGAQVGVISSIETDPAKLIAKAREIPEMTGLDLATGVSTSQCYEWTRGITPCSPSEQVEPTPETTLHVAAYDFGIKHNILRQLVQLGCRVTVVPAITSSEDVLALKPDGVFLSNGPGDPEPLKMQINNVRQLIGRIPLFGICLGHQILGLAVGGETFKLKFGHHGVNHPVRHEQTGKIEITSQNHGFAVDPDSLNATETEVTHLNLNDHTLEGFRSRKDPLFGVQYHPEAAPGPHDSRYLFGQFVDMMRGYQTRL
ncbi:MAG: carbamoyl phosphate synthase small subunit [Solibacterales bacterium]|nr:carbamoyl phosphate synthase small subunit [Bryobacterales bacterium]|tara:strand:+ start:3920 stop:5059 length:1140 start_codon:yes stop_codon:yes gene_type:complete